MKDWQEKWTKNYRGEGDCAELAERLKVIEYGGDRGNVSYLPWAVVERIFRFQGGETEVIVRKDDTRHSIVETDEVFLRTVIDPELGTVTEKTCRCYFVNVLARWEGQEHIERYPLLSNKGSSLITWTQADLNRSVQRAKVKAIAMVSGIGYKLFEDGDLQFPVNDEEPEPKPEPKPKTRKRTTKKSSGNDDLFTDIEETKAEPSKTKPEEPTEERIIEPKVEWNRDEAEDEIKRIFVSGGSTKAKKIQLFLEEHGTKKIQNLDDATLKELLSSVS